MIATTRRAAVLGSPVDHSLSPVLHGAAYESLGLPWSYERIDCDGDRLPALVGGAGPEWAAFSVTMPGKAAAATVADERSELVELLGVANSLYRGDHQGWRAENTDVDGVREALRAAGISGIRRPLILGSGHTARAALASVVQLGAEQVTVAARRPAAVLELAQALGVAAQGVGFRLDDVRAAAADADLVVSTVPAGVADELAPVLARVPVLLDAIYHPWPTPLAAAGAADRVTVTGLDMLMHQAFRQVELFTGQPAPREAMRSALRAATGSRLLLPTG